MSDIKWEDGVFCFANGIQQVTSREITKDVAEYALLFKDFHINEIIQGDYIEASELDTEQKYNDAVAAFGLFGFENNTSYSTHTRSSNLLIDDNGITVCSDGWHEMSRKITYPQLMAIGKLKRAMVERDSEMLSNNLKTAADKLGVSLESAEWPDLTKYPHGKFDSGKCSSDWSDKHYNYFYQLSEEDIKAGQIKVDAYFVNRMWKINSWEDTGAGFHILKTLPRIANNKNSLKRELVALKKQVDILCKLHRVDDDTN